MIFHENHLLADDSHEISYLIFSKIGKDVSKFVVCCSCDGALRVKLVSSLLPVWRTIGLLDTVRWSVTLCLGHTF